MDVDYHASTMTADTDKCTETGVSLKVPSTESEPTPRPGLATLSDKRAISSQDEEWRFTLTETSNSTLKRLPQYLFRVASDDSQGVNLTGSY